MIKLPLYRGAPTAPIEDEPPSDLDPACQRCALGNAGPVAKYKHRCIPPDGSAWTTSGSGALLVVADGVGRDEAALNRPLVGDNGQYIRRLVKQWWADDVVFDVATRCAPAGTTMDERFADACRGYLASTWRECAPSRVVAIGPIATHGVLGRAQAQLSGRKMYGWLHNGGAPVPVFSVMSVQGVKRNRFLQKWFEEDMRWALTTTRDALVPPQWHATTTLISSGAKRILVDPGLPEQARTARRCRRTCRSAPP